MYSCVLLNSIFIISNFVFDTCIYNTCTLSEVLLYYYTRIVLTSILESENSHVPDLSNIFNGDGTNIGDGSSTVDCDAGDPIL